MARWRWAMFGVLLAAAALAGCSNEDEMRWKEQVWLSDGRHIDVDRYSVALKSGFPNSTDGPPVYQEISYAPLGVHWSAKSGENGVPEMLSFEIVDGDAYLVVVASGNLEKFCADKPAGSYLISVYRWHNRIMQEIDQHEASIARMGINLSGTHNWGLRHADKPVNYISWEDIAFMTDQPAEGPPESIEKFLKIRKYLICS